MRLMSRLVLGLLLTAFSAAAHAQQYPSKPIRMVVSIAAGSVTDVIMRAAAAELQTRLGQPLVIENIGGAAGILGGKTCAQAAGDGYTICIIYHSTMSFNPLLFSNLPYNPDRPRPGGAAVLPGRRPVRLLGDQREHGRGAEDAGAVQARGPELRHARRRLLSRPVPEMAQQPVGHQDRRHPLSRRRTGGAGAGGQRRAGDALRRRQFRRRHRGRQGQGAGGELGQALAGAAERADLRRGRLGRLSGPGLVGPRGAEGHAAGDRDKALRANSRSCSAIRSSSPSSTSRRWWRRRPRRTASPRSSSRTARTPRR